MDHALYFKDRMSLNQNSSVGSWPEDQKFQPPSTNACSGMLTYDRLLVIFVRGSFKVFAMLKALLSGNMHSLAYVNHSCLCIMNMA